MCGGGLSAAHISPPSWSRCNGYPIAYFPATDISPSPATLSTGQATWWRRYSNPRRRFRGNRRHARDIEKWKPVLSPSTLTINVTGGTTAAYSNIALTFGGVAAGHFGGQPVNGNVQKSH
jgi:hypothetical protein